MLLDSVRSLFGRHAHAPQMAAQTTEAALSLVPDAGLATDDDPVWPSARISVAEALWGEGFLFPGGAAELLHLANPMGLSAASSLLLLGAGPGGATRCIASELGVWVTGYEANARLVALSNERSLRAGLGRRALVEQWSPHAPKFPLHYLHHAMAIEPLHGAKPEEALAAVSLALKPGGQFVLVELVADLALDPNDQMVAAWVRLDHRAPDIPSELRMTRILGRLGFDVRIVEDISRRHMQQAVAGWRTAVRSMEATRPTLQQVAMVVREAELWLARFRLMRAGKLRLVRWHAIGRANAPPLFVPGPHD
jgi:SAM-dependent methyltransferase